LRYFFDINEFPQRGPVLLIESGTRELLEKSIPVIRTFWGKTPPPIDVFTCFRGIPEGLPDDVQVYRVRDYQGVERKNLLRELKGRGYSVVAIVCSGEAILERWKWLLAASIPAKILIINESGDCFWCDRENWSAIREFILSRSGVTGATVLRSILQIAALPITFPFLLLFAAGAHSVRAFNRIMPSSRT
jgi:hypothetical protein